MKYWRGYLLAAIVAAITFGLTLLAKRFSALVDMVFPFLTREVQTFLASWTGGVDFPVWQVLLILLLVVLLATIVLMIVMRWSFVRWLGWVLAVVSIFWFLHTGLYGVNYYAGPLTDDIRMGNHGFTVQDLEKATIYFRDQANEMAASMHRDANGDLIFPGFETLAEKAGNGYHTLTYEQSGSVFAGSLEPVKELSWADLFSSMGVTGVTVSLTGEAAVNPQTPAVALPFAMCHEMAHRMSIARDDDANLAAFLACMANESPEFQYSGCYMAYRYCYEALLSAGTPEAAAAAARIDLEVNSYLRYDLKTYDRFFQRNRNDNATNAAGFFSNFYLRITGSDETTAYGQVASSLVNWYIEEKVLPFIQEDDPQQFDPTDKDYINDIIGGNG